jgi:2-oxoglutarate dehydrogenase E1 component
VLAEYPNAEIVWCQEEPENMGAWNFVDRKIEDVTIAMGTPKRPRFVGRVAAASPATGLAKVHVSEQNGLVDRALTLA